MKSAASICALALLLCASATGFSAQPSFPFDVAQIAGQWAENFNTDEACGASNLHFRFDRSVTALGETDRVSADILSATPRSLVIRYDNEKRLSRLRKPLEWELTVVAPGLYRWRATDWQEGEVNTVVGVRCSR
jgi:hypothetical protein